MKKDIHPEYAETRVTYTCGNSFATRFILTSGEVRVDVCSTHHPLYIGKQKISDVASHVNHSEVRCARYNVVKKAATEEKAAEVKKVASETTAAKQLYFGTGSTLQSEPVSLL